MVCEHATWSGVRHDDGKDLDVVDLNTSGLPRRRKFNLSDRFTISCFHYQRHIGIQDGCWNTSYFVHIPSSKRTEIPEKKGWSFQLKHTTKELHPSFQLCAVGKDVCFAFGG